MTLGQLIGNTRWAVLNESSQFRLLASPRPPEEFIACIAKAALENGGVTPEGFTCVDHKGRSLVEFAGTDVSGIDVCYTFDLAARADDYEEESETWLVTDIHGDKHSFRMLLHIE